MERTNADPDAVVTASAVERREDMQALDEVIRECLPGRSRAVWTGKFWGGTDQAIIGYGDIVQDRPRGPSVAWFAVGLAAQQRHCSVYVNAVDDGQYLIAAYSDRLGKVKVGAAAISIRRLADVDLDVLRELLCRADELTR
ncbi:MAG TPA: DUF1801 domain-containing protein [Aldersonia sp.]